MGRDIDRDVYRDPRAQARAAELARQPKAVLVNLALDAQTGATRAALMKWHKQVLAWTITCAEHTGHRAPAATGRGGAPAAETAPACRPAGAYRAGRRAGTGAGAGCASLLTSP